MTWHRYHAVFSTDSSGSYREWSATDDTAALADARLWAAQAGGRVVTLSECTDRTERPIDVTP